MSNRSTEHATFVIKRTYDATPERVFQAWADPLAKAQWFGPKEVPHEDRSLALDFSVGGREQFAVHAPGVGVYRYDAVYQDIVPGERIVYSYDMHLDEDRISVSLTTVEFAAAGARTRLTFTEQGVYLDGRDSPAPREHGTGELLNALARALAGGVVE